MSELRPFAVMRIEGEFAHICAWCPDKVDADAWASARGLKASHGICKACEPKLCTDVEFEAGERCVAPDSELERGAAARGTATDGPPRLVKFSCRLGGGK